MIMSGSAAEKNEGLLNKLFRRKNKRTSKSRSTERPIMTERRKTWPVPYLSKMEGNMQPGQSIVFSGFATGPHRFDLNLAGGPEMEGDKRSDIILHVGCRLDEKRIVLNTFSKNEWGKEERFKCPLKPGDEFHIRIRVHPDNFEIFINHQQLTRYAHILPISSITHMFANGQLELYSASWEGKYYSVPYEAGIPGNFYTGRKLYVSGEPENGAKRFEINLHSGQDIAFHFNPRFDEKDIVRNSLLGERWGEEERDGEFPFNKRRCFDISIVCEEDAFHCLVDGTQVCTFKHRIQASSIDRLSIAGELELQGVHFK